MKFLATEGATNLIWFVNQLETLAQVFNESAHNGSITLVVDGVSYYVNSDDISITGDVECSPGQTSTQYLCGIYVLINRINLVILCCIALFDKKQL